MGQRLLIMNKDENEFHFMKSFLNQFNFQEIIHAGSKEDGFSACQVNKPQVVIIDSSFGNDGLNECFEMKNKLLFSPKIILMVDRIDARQASQARTMGADDYCLKTKDFDHLIQAIKKLL